MILSSLERAQHSSAVDVEFHGYMANGPIHAEYHVDAWLESVVREVVTFRPPEF